MNKSPLSRKSRAPKLPFIAKKNLEKILQVIPAFVSVIDKNCRILFSNWRTGWGKKAPQNEINGLNCYDDYYPGTSTRIDMSHIEAVFGSGKTVVSEKYSTELGLLKIHAFPVYDDDGSIVMTVEYLDNVSVQKSLFETNQVLQAIINASPLAIIAFDSDLNILQWNPASEELFGWKKEEVLGRLFPIVPDDRWPEVLLNLNEMKKGKFFRSVEALRVAKDGTLIDVSFSTAPMLSQEGLTLGFMAIYTDVREAKQAQEALLESEANYRTIFDAANDAIFVFDPKNAEILDVNKKVCEMYGYSFEEVLQLGSEDLIAGDSTYASQDMLKMIRKTESGKSHTFELMAKDKEGRTFWVEVNMKGAIIGGKNRVLVVVRDISGRKAAQKESKRMQEHLRQVDKMAALGTLASGIAHEINNPNNFIQSNAKLISDIWPDVSKILTLHSEEKGEIFLGKLSFSEAGKLIPKMVDGLLDGSRRITGIVSELKNFARQEKIQLDQQVDINKVIRAALVIIQNQIRKHTDSFQCMLAENLPPVTGSFQQLEQVVINLIMNALQALPDRSLGASVCTSYAETLKQIVIEVRDEGGGMSREEQQAIFDPFYTTRHDSGGTGLGLSICFNIVKEHGGIIECESKQGQGSTFLVRLPVRKINQKGGDQ